MGVERAEGKERVMKDKVVGIKTLHAGERRREEEKKKGWSGDVRSWMPRGSSGGGRQ